MANAKPKFELERNGPSLVMNDINSLTHSCMHSLASFAILAFSGRAVFMIRATGAKLRMLASDDPSCFCVLEAEEYVRCVGSGDDVEEEEA